MSAEGGRVSQVTTAASSSRDQGRSVPWTSSPWARAAVIVLATRLIFMTVAYAASYYLSADTQGTPERGFFDIWVHWDALRFLTTAEHGYDSSDSTPNATAFFPLFPLAIRAVTALGINAVVAGLAIAALGSWVALAYLYRLAESDDPGTGRSALLYLALWPTAVFLIAPYSESLFLAGAIAAFYYARAARWHLVGVPAAVAMGSRFAGLFLVAGLAVEFLRQRRFSARELGNAALSLVIALLPLLAYAAFLARVKGNPLFFFVDQQEGWGRSFTGAVEAYMNSVERLATAPTGNLEMVYRLEIAGAIVGVAFVLWALTKKEWGYATYMGLLLGALLLSTEYMSIPRILLTFFPAALFVSQATRARPRAHETYLVATTMLMALGVIVYTRGGWFF